ncbi:hypothetical protein BH09BAC3_BH09BAC3_20770 [soil metagenome]
MKRFLRLFVVTAAFIVFGSAAYSQVGTSGTLVTVPTTYGTASATTTFVMTGTGTGDIVVTPPTGFEVSLTAGSGYTTSLSVGTSTGTSTTGDRSAITIYVRIAATTVPGSYLPGNVVCDPATGSNVNVATFSSVVSVKPLTITGATAANKVYNGNTTATMGGAPVLAGGLEGADVVTIGGAPAGTFSQSAIGVGLTVTASGYSLTGAQAARYSVSQPVGITAKITAKDLTITGVGAANRPYDQTLAATITGVPVLVGVVGAEVVTVTGAPVAAFATASAGVGKTVTFAGYTIGGADVANYTLLTQPASTTANITPIALTVTGLTGSNKVYDATTSASFTGVAALGAGVLAPDMVTLTGSGTATFATKTVGVAKTINVTGFTTGGTEGANYTITQPTLTGDITPFGLTITGVTANSKPFDGTNAATLSGSPTPVGVLGADNVTIVGPPTATFASNGPGVAIIVTVTGYTLGGTDGGNYTVSQPTGLTATIFGNTDVLQITGGVQVGPTVNNSLGNVGLLGFSLNNPGTTSNFQSITFTTTSDPTLLFNTISLVSSTDAIYDAGDPAVTASLGTTATSISFTGITGQTITGGATVYYYFLKVALKPILASVDPTIKISFTPATDLAFSGGIIAQGAAVNTINGGNSAYTIHDDIAPTIVSMTNSLATIYQGALTQTVTVVFNEKMNNTVNPIITMSAGTWGVQAAGSWNSPTDNTYTTTLTHGASPEETIAGVTSVITTPPAFAVKDVSNNTLVVGSASASGFLLDNRKPIATVATLITAPGAVTTNNLTGLQIQVTYDKPMVTSVGAKPTISIIGSTSFNPLPAGVWSVGNTVYTVSATHNGTVEELTGITAQAVGGLDLPNNIPLTAVSPGFVIDTKRPTFTSITRQTTRFTSGSTANFIVTFADVINIDVADLQLVPSGTVAFTPITGASITTVDFKVYTVAVTGITGDGDLRLDINAGATITDVYANSLIVPGVGIPGQFYTFDQIAPTVSSILLAPGFKEPFTSALVSGTIPALHSTKVEYIITFSEPVNGVTFADFTTSTAGPILTNGTLTAETAAPATQWRLSYNYTSGTGLFNPNFVKATVLIQDQALNVVSTATFFGGTICTVLPGEPSSPIASLNPSPLPTSVTVTWTDVATPVLPTHYLVVLRTTGTQPVVDGGFVFDDSNLADGIMTLNVAQGVQSANFAGIPLGTQYNVAIYPYTLAANTINGADRTAIDFNTTTPARVSRASDIIADAAFPYTNNIDYATANNQLNAITLNTHGTAMERFIVRDGGGTADDDNLPTQLGAITLKITNYQNLRRVALINANTGLVVLDRATAPVINVVGNTGELVFNTFANPFSVADNGTNNLVVRATFIANGVVDNSVVSFQITGSTSLTGTGTSLFSNHTPTGILGTNTVDENKIEVTASSLDFTNVLMPTSITINQNFTPVTVEARDGNQNRDLDFIASPTVTNSNAPPLSMINVPAGPFVAGVLNFPANFQFTSPPSVTPTFIIISAGGINNQFSPAIDVSSSKQSTLTYVPGGLTRINYIYAQATNIIVDPNSVPLATLRLSDGVVGSPDVDGAATKIKSITFDITTTDILATTVGGSKEIRQIALYNQAGLELGEQTLGAATSVTFNIALPANYITAADDNVTTFTVRASFKSGAANIQELDNIRLQVTNVLLDVGSEFNPVSSVTSGSWTKATGAVTSASQTPTTDNIIDIVATKLDFTTQPAAFEGINNPVVPATVTAHDQFGLVDSEFNFPATLSASAIPSGSFAFVKGIMSLAGMTYTNTGDGTLTVVAGTLRSDVNNVVGGLTNQAVQSTQVDVIHVTATYAPNGVTSSTNLIGGTTTNAVIYGVTFAASDPTASKPNLNQFIISFSNPITNVLYNARVFESTNGTYITGLPDVTSGPIGGIVTQSGSSVTVTFPSGKERNLSSGALSYFLMIDVDAQASGSTPQIQPSVIDNGFGSPSDNNIVTDAGTATSGATSGKIFTFASIFPPTLTSSVPAKGQLNVDPNQSTISLTFSVPVWSLDQTIVLHDQANPAITFTLTATNGAYVPIITGDSPAVVASKTALNKSTLAQPLIFSLPSALLQDHVYYITIAVGQQTALTGIMDEQNNLFPGISYPGELYFKTAKPAAPLLLGVNTPVNAPSNPTITNISTSGAVINATFDQRGKAYYLVLAAGSTAPSKAQINGGSAYAGFFARGTFNITQTNPIAQSGVVIPSIPFIVGNFYEVWMYAENDALPTPFSPSSPYGSIANNFIAGTSGPTITFPTAVPPTTTLVSLNNPSMSICNNSFQILNSPIIITEGIANQFTTTGARSINFVLPAGFQFDVSLTAGKPTYGNVQVTGSDWTAGPLPAPPALSFLGNSILTLTFTNRGSTSLDKIIITGLRVISSGSNTGSIFRLGGNAIPAIGDQVGVGTISSSDATAIGFTNSYSIALGSPPSNVVTSIPDNAQPVGVVLSPTNADGSPLFGPGNTNTFGDDYGPSSFSGQGVSVNVLTISAVTLDAPFNIAINHTDNNGCKSTNTIQYTVYNHNTAINITTGLLPGGLTDLTNTYCAVNDKFVVNQQTNRPTYGRTSPTNHVRYADWQNLSAYFMKSMTAAIPSSVPPQIISGPTWDWIVANMPKSSLPPAPPVQTGAFLNYKFDDAEIADAYFLSRQPGSPGPINDPYESFKATIPSVATGATLTYYRGGSLGFVDLTAIFQSRTNSAVKVPRVQRIEFWLPAVPVIDADKPSVVDITDPNNLPAPLSGPADNPGTLVYCQYGGVIRITAYPTPIPTKSQGTFTLQQINGTIITTTAFKDNTNGTAELDPALFNNNFNDIKIIYTFQDLAATAPTCPGSSYQVIRVTPNPVASFSTKSMAGVNIENVDKSFCVDNVITFDETSTGAVPPKPPSSIAAPGVTTPATPANFIKSYLWNFGDINPPAGFPNQILVLSGGASPTHKFGKAQNYDVTLTEKSNWGCPSVPVGSTIVAPLGIPTVVTLPIGGIPLVKYKLDGVSINDVFRFNSNDFSTPFPASGNFTLGANPAANNTFIPNSTATAEGIKRFEWDFGDGSANTFVRGTSDSPPGLLANDNQFNANVVTHDYNPSVGRKDINLIVTSNLGCVNSLALQKSYRSIVVLDRANLAIVPPATTSSYVSRFDLNNNKWQVWGTGKTVQEISNGQALATWEYGRIPDFARYGYDLVTPPNPVFTGQKIWGTNIEHSFDSLSPIRPDNRVVGTYNPNEKSALYSPSFDLTSLTRPMISFSSVIRMLKSDGVVLEYSKDDLNIADPNKVWTTLGVIDDGEGWYTDQGIAGRPGTQSANDYGWSGQDSSQWLSSRHVLDDMFNIGILPKKAVFRWALGSAATKVDVRAKGFALTEVRIGDRTRTILLESFASTSNSATGEKLNNDFIAAFNPSTLGNLSIGTEIVKINYHLGFPAKDPFNDDNPADPSSRALLYNITSTPKSLLDGEKDKNDRPAKDWIKPLYNKRTLQLAQADITITAGTPSLTDGSRDITATITSTVLSGIPPATIIHIAVLEESIPILSLTSAQNALVKSGETTFEYVLKRMLPSAAGTRMGSLTNGAPLPNGATKPLTVKYIPERNKLYGPTGDLSVAVFLQEESGKHEIYQVEILRNISEPGVVTGLEPIAAESIIVHPVPSNQEMNIALPGQLVDNANVQLIDQLGRVVHSSSINAGADSKVIRTDDLAAGVYILQVEVGTGNFTRKKIIIAH